jgi:hypothetical protein
MEYAPLADIELNATLPDVLLLVKVTVETALLLPTVTVPKFKEVGETVYIAKALIELSTSRRADK